MSINRTENYQLHVWGAEDEESLAELNENFAKLDEKAVRVVTGSYVGQADAQSTEPLRIELGEKLKAVFVCRTDQPARSGSSYMGLGTQGSHMRGALKADETGFSVYNQSSEYNFLNQSGTAYFYVVWV